MCRAAVHGGREVRWEAEAGVERWTRLAEAAAERNERERVEMNAAREAAEADEERLAAVAEGRAADGWNERGEWCVFSGWIGG